MLIITIILIKDCAVSTDMKSLIRQCVSVRCDFIPFLIQCNAFCDLTILLVFMQTLCIRIPHIFFCLIPGIGCILFIRETLNGITVINHQYRCLILKAVAVVVSIIISAIHTKSDCVNRIIIRILYCHFLCDLRL